MVNFFSLDFCKFCLFELSNMNRTFFNFMLVIHHFIKSNELKLIEKLILWNFCVNTYITSLLSELISS